MAEEEGGISRREFLKDAGLAVGGVAVSSTVLGACAPKEVIKEVPGKEATKEVPGPTKTVEVTKEVPEKKTKLTINGEIYELKINPNWTLQYTLHNELGLKGTRLGCDQGECGTCTVIVDGKAVYSCITLAADMEGHKIETLEGLTDRKTGKLHPLQEAAATNCTGCMYCITGTIMAAKAFLAQNPNPTRQEIKEGIAGNLCKCGEYGTQIDAWLIAAAKMRGG